ncbi:glycosyltransferase family 2 protein [Vibrio sp. JC009]|uniref:glycosyltransferase family 2 protein n=1 Tax=Vibrio sp. JC009 TaxID=2912314 RepID=UPI0023AF8234|nr:glycosyltransferase family 2 protein [Vibrio sp. JC009]WED24156.1 glycosyltransferase family 2 protein [Vibrio sp. JC009]
MQSSRKLFRLPLLFSSSQGALDCIHEGHITGWYISHNNDHKFKLFANGTFLGLYSCNSFRPDLINISDKELCGFRIPICPSLLINRRISFKLTDCLGKVVCKKTLIIENQNSTYNTNFDLKDYLYWARENSLTPYGLYNFSHKLIHTQKSFQKRLTTYNNELIKFSIIIPTYNRSKYIIDALNSVKQQTYSNYEVIIVDDGSDDNTKQAVKNFISDDSKFQYINYQPNRGVSIARNIGIKQASGDVIAFLDSDNTWDSSYLRTLSYFYDKYNWVDSYYTGMEIWISDAVNYFYKTGIMMRKFSYESLKISNYIDLNCFSYRSSKKYYFDQKLNRLVDWEYILRIARTNNIRLIPLSLVRYQIYENLIRITNSVEIKHNLDLIKTYIQDHQK